MTSYSPWVPVLAAILVTVGGACSSDDDGGDDGSSDGTAAVTDGTIPADAQELIGSTAEDFAVRAEQMGYTVRIVEEDGEDLAYTEDFVENRLNVAVDADAIVTEIKFVG